MRNYSPRALETEYFMQQPATRLTLDIFAE